MSQSLGHKCHRNLNPDASLVLVGIRGCGKRSLGFVAAAALKRRFITEDHYFKQVTGLTRHEYLKRFGSQEFQKRDIEVLKMMLDKHRSRCVIECGLGSLTRPVQEYLRLYSATNPVVYVVRDMFRIQTLLGLEDQAVKLLCEGDPLHRMCSNFEFYNIEDRSSMLAQLDEVTPDRRSAGYSFKLKEAKEDFTRFVRFITGADVNHSSYDSPFVLLETPPENRSFTHAILIRSSEMLQEGVDLCELESGGDAIELCVDRWDTEMASTVSKQISLLRRSARIPIIFSIDASTSGIDNGTLSPAQLRSLYFEIAEHGLRLAVEYLAIDLDQDKSLLAETCRNRGMTKIIGQHIFKPSSSVMWDDESCLSLYLEAEKLGFQLVRILRVATEREDNAAVAKFINKIQSLPGEHLPIIAYNVGSLGRTSQVFNSTLTSVTHPAIKRPTGNRTDPLITSRDAVQALFQSYVLDPLQFYILGASVAYSLSPAMYNAAFHHCGMSHTYSIPESPSLTALDKLGRDPHFGGASVVQPWRVQIFQKLSSKSRHAEAIGAINTIMPLRARADGTMFPLQEQASRRNQAGPVLGWYGENTDWVGIMTCMNRNLSPRNAISPLKTTGLVIGAGGMGRAAIYAMLRLGCRKIFIYNRTLSRAENVARHFNSWAASQVGSTKVVHVLKSLQDEWPSDTCHPCLIASCVPADPDQDEPPANFEMPMQWLESPTGGVVLEFAYKPLETPLLRQMRRFRSETGRPWVLVDGLDNVIEQAIAQFELLTGRKAPRRLMTLEALRNYVGEHGQFDEETIQARLDGVQ
ncbi:type I 3-dehydroquinase-domain-containing protein [Aspergillus pseudonomiae]|uniref:Type I 3-dehydroquinase-domain-containing protein n=1 Tax=Aspergillus pseudonomiae TaxID=1506151 RepID=A0A5N7DAH4_9EURO|nr:type I 3-dehydroquinase-domain-containing protein [Aspergillus pseudonomiae]KAB8258457.1 type I 3-dehydroquinase-domain-containing protein [Aspergillus pseudonomiae]KAE8403239.1 type I 3-dehydroquinase-domain-containing protein [Aspergillus pseudonomiae]